TCEPSRNARPGQTSASRHLRCAGNSNVPCRRPGCQLEVRSRGSGVGSRGSGVRSQESGVRSRESEVKSQRSGVRVTRPAPQERNSAPEGRWVVARGAANEVSKPLVSEPCESRAPSGAMEKLAYDCEREML